MSELERDILIARVADGDASEQEWTTFRAWAERDALMWRELAELQRDAAALTSAVNRAVGAADFIEAPVGEHMSARLTERFRMIGLWGGWAAAAALVLVWATGWRLPSGGLGTGADRASLPLMPTGSPQDTLRQYLDQGRQSGTVVGQVPEFVMQDVRPAPDGQFEVIFIRQIMERAVVDDLYGLGADDAGRAVPLRLRRVAPGERPF
ncbi:MAG: hypothetical protein ACKVU4_08580 [Phycisphaerales bacterium]